MKTTLLILALAGIAFASPLVKRDAPYPASLPHSSSYGEPIRKQELFVAPIAAPLPIVKIEAPAIESIPETPTQEYGPPETSFIAPAAPALPELPRLPEVVISHIPEAPKTIEAELPIKAIFNAPYPAPVEPPTEYGPPPPAIKESKPLIVEVPETPAEEYGVPQTSFIAPPAPALPSLPALPELIIPHIPEAPKAIEASLPVYFNAPYPAPVEPPTEYGPPPPAIKESKPLIVESPETPAEEYGVPQTNFIAPAAPALPALPALPAVIIPHFPEAPKNIEAERPVAIFNAPYPAPIEPPTAYGPPPPAIKESRPIIVEEPAEEYGPPQVAFIAPAAPALPALPRLPELVIRHFPEAPKTIETSLPVATIFNAPYPAPVEIPAAYGPPPAIKESRPIIYEEPAEEYGPPQVAFFAPAPPALPLLPNLPEVVIRHFPEAPKEVAAPLPIYFNAPYPAPVEPPSEYGPPTPAIKESKPLIIEIPETPAEEYGVPQTNFIAPPAPALPALPALPELIIPHIPEAPKAIETVLPIKAVFDAPYPAPVEPPTEYGPPPPAIKESKPVIAEISETPAEEYGVPQTNFIAPPAPALPALPALPTLIIPHIPEAPKTIEATLPIKAVFDAPYPAPIPHEVYGVPTTTLPPPTTTTLPVPTGPYPAAGPISHYGDPIQKSTPFFIRVNSKNKGYSFVEIGGLLVAQNNKLLVDEGSFTYYDNNSNPIHVRYHTNN